MDGQCPLDIILCFSLVFVETLALSSLPVNVSPDVKKPLDNRRVLSNTTHVQDILAVISVMVLLRTFMVEGVISEDIHGLNELSRRV